MCQKKLERNKMKLISNSNDFTLYNFPFNEEGDMGICGVAVLMFFFYAMMR